jgi:hypothetical protein
MSAQEPRDRTDRIREHILQANSRPNPTGPSDQGMTASQDQDSALAWVGSQLNGLEWELGTVQSVLACVRGGVHPCLTRSRINNGDTDGPLARTRTKTAESHQAAPDALGVLGVGRVNTPTKVVLGAAFVVAAVYVGSASCATAHEYTSNHPPTYTSPKGLVLYEAEGSSTSSGDIDVRTPTGSRQISADLPLGTTDGRTGLTMRFKPGSLVYMSVQNNEDHGMVTCRITVDGRVISENTASGGFMIATCNGTV